MEGTDNDPDAGAQRPALDRLRRFWQVHPGAPNLLSTAGSFSPPVGSRIDSEGVSGYYIDFSSKADSTEWPPDWLPAPEDRIHVASTQLALGCIERYLAGDGDEWLATAITIADELIEEQGSDGGWPHQIAMPHSYWLPPPWLSAMAQGEGASVFVRLHGLTKDERYAEAALAALKPMRTPTREGGVATELGGGFFPEEYPTNPSSYVLNGAIFALWGLRDVGLGLDDRPAMDLYEEGVETLAREINRFDTGSWSLYDLFPHPIPNIASGAYHQLHITQLEALTVVSPRPELIAATERFRDYQQSRAAKTRATATKVAFRLVVPRNTRVAERLPWRHRPDHGEVLVLCYHAVSDTWPSRLAVTAAQLESQVGRLVDRGYEGVTFSDAVLGDPAGKRVAVTFDDAYESMLTAAAPVLAGLGVPGTVFVPTDFPGVQPLTWPGIEDWADGPHADELQALTWDQVRELEAAGWEIGSHTCSHPRLPELDDEELAAELVASRAKLESELAHHVRSIAYPYGAVDERVILATRDAGYLTGASLPTRFEPPRALSWPRVGIYRADNQRAFALKSSRALRRIRESGAWTVAERVSRARNVASARLIS